MYLFVVIFEPIRILVNRIVFRKRNGRKLFRFGESTILFSVRNGVSHLHIGGIKMGVGYELRFNNDLRHIRWDPVNHRFTSSVYGDIYKVGKGYLLTISHQGKYCVIVCARSSGEAKNLATSAWKELVEPVIQLE